MKHKDLQENIFLAWCISIYNI